jgi:Gas vesicle synthesis protein GvpL/GvpF
MPVAEQSEGARQPEGSAGADRGCYVYGIVPHDVEPVPGALGVGDPAGQVQVVRHGEIAALVSEVNVARPLGRPEDLRAHQELLDGTVTTVPVLPFRFGAVMTDAGAVAEELLAPQHEEFAAALEDSTGAPSPSSRAGTSNRPCCGRSSRKTSRRRACASRCAGSGTRTRRAPSASSSAS